MSMVSIPSPLVSVDWLNKRLGSENLVILDASVPPIMPFTVQTLPAELTARYIPGSLRFDYDTKVCDQNSTLPHMMPNAEFFTQQVRSLGINKDSAIVVYDDIGVYASPRAWWMFKAMGQDNVTVLNGGAVAWQQAGLDMTDQIPVEASQPGDFESQENVGRFCDALIVYQLLNEESCSIFDARSEGQISWPRP